jgi:glutamate racemase
VLAELIGADIGLIDNGAPVARQTRRMLTQLAAPDRPGRCQLLSTGAAAPLQHAARRWLQLDVPVDTLQR